MTNNMTNVLRWVPHEWLQYNNTREQIRKLIKNRDILSLIDINHHYQNCKENKLYIMAKSAVDCSLAKAKFGGVEIVANVYSSLNIAEIEFLYAPINVNNDALFSFMNNGYSYDHREYDRKYLLDKVTSFIQIFVEDMKSASKSYAVFNNTDFKLCCVIKSDTRLEDTLLEIGFVYGKSLFGVDQNDKTYMIYHFKIDSSGELYNHIRWSQDQMV